MCQLNASCCTSMRDCSSSQHRCTHKAASLPLAPCPVLHMPVQGVVVMIESEGITEQVASPRYDVVASIMDAVGPESVMFEAAEPEVFSW